jgi:hypothetical protein
MPAGESGDQGRRQPVSHFSAEARPSSYSVLACRSYKGKHDRGAVSRAAALRRQFQAAKAEAAADDRKARARVAEEVRELDAQQAEILSRSPPLLSEHTSQLAHRLLNPPKYYEK